MSIPFFALAFVGLFEKIFRRKIFSPRDWSAAWIFGAVASLVLYPSALGLTRIDIYTLGWASWAFWSSNLFVAMVATVAIFLLWNKNKFGILLLFALAAFAFQLKSSTNFWDYFIDPIYGAVSLMIVLKNFLIKMKKNW